MDCSSFLRLYRRLDVVYEAGLPISVIHRNHVISQTSKRLKKPIERCHHTRIKQVIIKLYPIATSVWTMGWIIVSIFWQSPWATVNETFLLRLIGTLTTLCFVTSRDGGYRDRHIVVTTGSWQLPCVVMTLCVRNYWIFLISKLLKTVRCRNRLLHKSCV